MKGEGAPPSTAVRSGRGGGRGVGRAGGEDLFGGQAKSGLGRKASKDAKGEAEDSSEEEGDGKP